MNPAVPVPNPASPDGSGRAAPPHRDPIPAWAACLAVAVAAMLVYIPAFRNGFMESWDDGVYLVSNRDIRAPDALTRIWTTLEMPRSYPNYPLVFTSYWIEYRLAGLNPTVYHATNVVLHALNAAMVFLVLRSLTAPHSVAFIVALLFAVHPIQVESVAWITERKNVLSAFFYLSCFLAFRKCAQKPAVATYGMCLLLYILALLSKTASVTLVPSLFLAAWLLDKRRIVRSCIALLPMLLLGLAAAFLTSHIEQEESSVPVALLVRPFLAARTAWFYAGKLFWPYPLLAVYPKWDGLIVSTNLLTFASPPPVFWLALFALVATFGLILILRRRLAPLALFGIGHFIVTMLPILGLIHFGYLAHTFVADRFAYLGGIGLFLAVVMLLRRLLALIPSRPVRITAALSLASAIFTVLAPLTWRQARLWKDSLSLWQYTLRFNDSSYDAHNAVGVELAGAGQLDAAIYHYQRAIQIQPKAKYYTNLGNVYARRSQFQQAITYYLKALQSKGDYAKGHYNLGNAYWNLGQFDRAAHHLREAVKYDPQYVKALDALAWLLAICPDDRIRNGPDALRHAQRVTELEPTPDPRQMITLAAAYAETGQFDRAVETANRALARITNPNDPLASYLRRLIRQFQSGRPLRTPGP